MAKAKLESYRKTVVAAVGAILTWAGAAYVPDGHVDRAEWYVLAVALAGAAGVWVAPNRFTAARDEATTPAVDPAQAAVYGPEEGPFWRVPPRYVPSAPEPENGSTRITPEPPPFEYSEGHLDT